MALHTLYVYGTLRSRDVGNADFHWIKGALYNLGSFPGLKLYEGCNSEVKCEKIVVDDEKLAALDRYEGYREDSPETSLYLRVPILDGWVYTYNHEVDPKSLISSGDWFNRETEEEFI